MLWEEQTSAQCLLVEITTATKSKIYNNYMIVDSMIQSKTVFFLYLFFCKKCAACYKDIQFIVCECNEGKAMKEVEEFPYLDPKNPTFTLIYLCMSVRIYKLQTQTMLVLVISPSLTAFNLLPSLPLSVQSSKLHSMYRGSIRDLCFAIAWTSCLV